MPHFRDWCQQEKSYIVCYDFQEDTYANSLCFKVRKEIKHAHLHIILTNQCVLSISPTVPLGALLGPHHGPKAARFLHVEVQPVHVGAIHVVPEGHTTVQFCTVTPDNWTENSGRVIGLLWAGGFYVDVPAFCCNMTRIH